MYTRIDSLSTYKNIIKNSFKLKKLILHGNHSPKIKRILDVTKYHDYIQQKLKNKFKLNQRLNQLNQEDFENGKLISDALKELVDSLSREEFKRVKIKKSEELFLLNTAIEGIGNKKYHDELLNTFIEIRKYKKENKMKKKLTKKNLDKETEEIDE
eukprot:gene12777-7051_t